MKDYSKYLKDGRRVAAFGQQIDNELEIFFLYCSKKDHFSKYFARNIYEMYRFNNYNLEFIKSYQVNPVVLRISIKKGDSAEYTFRKYMRDNFFKKIKTGCFKMEVKEYLIDNKGAQIYLGGTKHYRSGTKKLSERNS